MDNRPGWFLGTASNHVMTFQILVAEKYQPLADLEQPVAVVAVAARERSLVVEVGDSKAGLAAVASSASDAMESDTGFATIFLALMAEISAWVV